MILYSSKDAKNHQHAQLSLEEQMSICQMKYRGIIFILYRSLHDSICVAKRTLQSGQVVAGGGAVDVALSIHLDEFCKKYSGK